MKLTHKEGNTEFTYDYKRHLLCLSQKVEGADTRSITYGADSMEQLQELIETVLESNKYQNRSK